MYKFLANGWIVVGLTGLWGRGHSFHRTMSFPDTVWPEKYPCGRKSVFLRPRSEVFIDSHRIGSSLASFCYSQEGRLAGPVS